MFLATLADGEAKLTQQKYRGETPGGIGTKFCTSVDIHDLITLATFCDDRLRGLGVAMGRISRFPIDLRRRLLYTTLSHYRASVYDMNENCLTHFNQKVN